MDLADIVTVQGKHFRDTDGDEDWLPMILRRISDNLDGSLRVPARVHQFQPFRSDFQATLRPDAVSVVGLTSRPPATAHGVDVEPL